MATSKLNKYYRAVRKHCERDGNLSLYTQANWNEYYYGDWTPREAYEDMLKWVKVNK